MLAKNKIKPKFYKCHRIRNGKEENFFNQKNLFSIAEEALKKKKKVSLEIGFGDGKSVIHMATKKKESYFFCIESYSRGTKLLTNKIQNNRMKNIFILYGDAIDIVDKLFHDKTIDEIFLFFPDPWPKKRHKKRRVVNPYSINLFFEKLKDKGLFHFTTDNINYAYETRTLLSDFFSKRRKIEFSSCRGNRPITKYENKALDKKNIIYDILIEN